MNDRVRTLALAQHGVVTRRQLLGHGVSPDAVRHLRTDRRFRLAVPGTYVLEAMPPTWEQEVWLACAAYPLGALSHESAAVWLQLPNARREGRPTLLIPVEVTTTRGVPARLIRSRNFDRDLDVVKHLGVPTTNSHRTVIDTCLAWARNTARVSRFLDACLHENRVTLAQLWETFLRVAGRGRKGSTVVRAALEVRSDNYRPAESELERIALIALEAAGLQIPTVQPPHPTRPNWRVDLVFEPERVILELDGRQHQLPEQRDLDYFRDAEAASNGYVVLRFSWTQVTKQRNWFVNVVRQTLHTRTARKNGA